MIRRERERSHIRFGSILFKAGTQEEKWGNGNNARHEQLWKQRMGAAFFFFFFVQAL